ncbi:MAG TPA: hypothetical protein VIL74_22170 [Pyrinomonadaceae bacterium]|jgi:hypothetical protein
MKIHVLPGDALADDFRKTAIGGETIVCRECLVEGAVRAENLEEFWRVRARFIEKTYGGGEEEYSRRVKGEFEMLQNHAGREAEINLWFEYELFCQVNLWFCLYLLRESEAKIFRVAPVVREGGDIWKGFGGLAAADLEKCYARRAAFSKNEISLGAELWTAFQNADHEKLERLSVYESESLPFLTEVCRAEIEKRARPRRVLEKIIAEGKTDFAEIFPAFSARAGVYGFGDAQVKRILDEI